jgi:serine/threonine-protein kinase
MELLEGVELRDRMAQDMLQLHEAVDIAAQVAAALGAAHARGVVHRDIKPGNIMLLPDGHAKIMDFGIARMQKSDVRTDSGTMMGSPKYMSPEQVAGHAVDLRTDIFSLGAMLYEMLTGAPPFSGNNLGELLKAIMHGTAPPPSQSRAGVSASLDAVIERAMQKNPAARYQDAGEMAKDLAQCRAAIHRVGGTRSASVPTAAPADPYAATAPIDTAAELVATAPQGLALSPDFDSSAGLQHLLDGADGGGAAPEARKSAGRMAWALAYGAAAIAAFAIALR